VFDLFQRYRQQAPQFLELLALALDLHRVELRAPGRARKRALALD
jgi:hypothetical protein